MRTPLSSFNLSQNLFSVYFREALCYDEFETSNNFDLELKTNGPKTEVLEPMSIDTNRDILPRLSVETILPDEGCMHAAILIKESNDAIFIKKGNDAILMQGNIARRSI